MPVEPIGPPSAPDRDWPAQAADSIVDVVDRVREQTTAKAVVAARGAVFGVVISIVLLIGCVTFVIGLTRAFQVGLTKGVSAAGGEISHAQAVWISYLLVGALFIVVGGFLWRAANRRAVQTLDQETP